jgi:hypothetical protein
LFFLTTGRTSLDCWGSACSQEKTMRFLKSNSMLKNAPEQEMIASGGKLQSPRVTLFALGVSSAIMISSVAASAADPTDEQAKAGFARATGFMQTVKTPAQVREFGRHAGIVGVAEDLCHRERAFWFRVVGVNARKLEPNAFFEGHAEGVMFMSKLKASKPPAAICEVTLALYGVGGSAVDGALQ